MEMRCSISCYHDYSNRAVLYWTLVRSLFLSQCPPAIQCFLQSESKVQPDSLLLSPSDRLEECWCGCPTLTRTCFTFPGQSKSGRSFTTGEHEEGKISRWPMRDIRMKNWRIIYELHLDWPYRKSWSLPFPTPDDTQSQSDTCIGGLSQVVRTEYYSSSITLYEFNDIWR